MEKKLIRDYIKKATYDNYGQYIWGEEKKGGLHKIADLRGWGTIQYLFNEKGEYPKAEAFQDELGQWICDAINEKIEREKKTDRIESAYNLGLSQGYSKGREEGGKEPENCTCIDTWPVTNDNRCANCGRIYSEF